MAGEERRYSTVLTINPFIEVTDTTMSPSVSQPILTERTPSPTDELLSWKNSPKTKHRNISETQYAETEIEELLSMLRETESLEEQGDILQYIVSYPPFRCAKRSLLQNITGIVSLLYRISTGGFERTEFRHGRNGGGSSRPREGSAEKSLREGVPAKNVGHRATQRWNVGQTSGGLGESSDRSAGASEASHCRHAAEQRAYDSRTSAGERVARRDPSGVRR